LGPLKAGNHTPTAAAKADQTVDHVVQRAGHLDPLERVAAEVVQQYVLVPAASMTAMKILNQV
jgi:hypothetical protein